MRQGAIRKGKTKIKPVKATVLMVVSSTQLNSKDPISSYWVLSLVKGHQIQAFKANKGNWERIKSPKLILSLFGEFQASRFSR